MSKLTFTAVTEDERSVFHTLMLSYAAELDKHQNRTTDPAILIKWTDSIIEKQSCAGQCLRLCYNGAECVGFLYAKIDRPEDKGYKHIGHGYIMEFYVLPEHRRKSHGREMLSHIESYFADNNVRQIYLTADPVTGKPFWEAMGYISAGELSPDNGQEIYEKTLSHKSIEYIRVKRATAEDAVHISTLYNENISALHGSDISIDEWHRALSDNDPDELHLLIYSGDTPTAWLKLNGLATDNDTWISMLAVLPKMQRQGFGAYAIRYAEKYCKSCGRKVLFIKTTEDNFAAQRLYQKSGYSICRTITYTTMDGISRNGIVFHKTIE